MARPPAPVFLERRSYRRRRLRDAVRLLPVLGLVLVAVPVLWSQEGTPSLAARTAALFGGWLALIALTAVLARALARTGAHGGTSGGAGGGTGGGAGGGARGPGADRDPERDLRPDAGRGGGR